MPYIVPEGIPTTCGECPFLSKAEEVPLLLGKYEKICRCTISPEEIEDPYHNLYWLINNKPKWCPLKEVKLNDRSTQKRNL